MAAAWHRDQLDLDGDGSTTDSVWVYPLYDGAFDCVGLCGPAGNVVESYVSSYAGAMTITNAVGNAIAASALGWQQGYAGYYRDDETGLQYATLRYYDPETGRFTTEDPIGRWGDGANLGSGYALLGNRYRSGLDPFGLDGECPCGRTKYVLLYADSSIDDEPDERSWFGSIGWVHDFRNREYWKLVDRLRASLIAKGYEIHEFVSPTDDAKARREKSEAFRAAKKAALRDPCFRGYTSFSHGAVRGDGKKKRKSDLTGALWQFGSLTNSNQLKGLDHKLDFVLIWACGGAVPPPAPTDPWTSYVSSADDFVASDDMVETGPTTSSGSDLVDRMTKKIGESNFFSVTSRWMV